MHFLLRGARAQIEFFKFDIPCRASFLAGVLEEQPELGPLTYLILLQVMVPTSPGCFVGTSLTGRRVCKEEQSYVWNRVQELKL